MKWAVLIAVLVAGGTAAAFWFLDVRTAAMVVFALVAAGFFGSLPWVIGGVMDRKRGRKTTGGVVVKGFGDSERPDNKQ
jgi:hypothetical protein